MNVLPKQVSSSRMKHSASRSLIFLMVTALSLSLATGCHKKRSGIDPNSLGPSTASAPVPTAALTANPVAIDPGQTVMLSWHTTNANLVTIDGLGELNPNGTQSVSPSTSTSYHLTAKGEGGATEADVRVTVRPAPAGSTGLDSANTHNGSDVSDTAFHAAVQDVFFDYDSYDLRPDGQNNAAQAAAYLVAHPGVKVLVGGYCDERGSAEYNLALGENRANSARSALVDAGVAAGRIRSISYGKEKQFCNEANESCWQENRRAQFTIDR